MSRNKGMWFILFVLTAVMLLSCNNADDSVTINGYNPGTDAQYFQTNNLYMYTVIQETENGCYLYHDQ